MAETPEEELDNANVSRLPKAGGDFSYMAEKGGEEECWQGWFDGAAQPNPGRIGIGATLLSPSGQRGDLSRQAGIGCNNEAELLALIAVLEQAMAAGARQVRVCGDSDVAIRAGRACLAPETTAAGGSSGAGGQFVKPAAITQVPRLLPLIARLGELLAGFETVELVWIPRHRNGDADRLSRQALGLPDKPAAWPGKKVSGQRSRRRR